MKFSLYCVFFTCFLSSVQAQRCATFSYGEKNTPSLNSDVSSRVTFPTQILKDEIITIPVVIHVLYNNATENISDAQILSQIESLNNDYRRLNSDTINTPAAFAAVAADTRITFCLAKTDPKGRRTTGIVRKYTSTQNWLADDEMKYSSKGGDNAWDSKKYLNIWVCNLFGRMIGYATLPGTAADKDGLVIKYNAFGTKGTLSFPYNKGRTATHEIGHWLGLMHLWGDKSCGDDGVSDTPPQQSSNSGCTSFPHKSACSINSNGDMFMNFMDFSDDACMNMFTTGQKNKMRSLFVTGGARNSFLTANGCDTSLVVPEGALPGELTETVSIQIYPNPAIDKLNIKSADATELIGKPLLIVDVMGKTIITKVLISQTNTISLTGLRTGIYFVQIGEGGQRKTFKFLKQ